MARWKVVVPPPKAERMRDNCEIHLQGGSGWGPGFNQRDLLPPGTTEVILNLPNSYDWWRDTDRFDGSVFQVHAEYKNSTGSRTERIELTPTRLPDEEVMQHGDPKPTAG